MHAAILDFPIPVKSPSYSIFTSHMYHWTPKTLLCSLKFHCNLANQPIYCSTKVFAWRPSWKTKTAETLSMEVESIKNGNLWYRATCRKSFVLFSACPHQIAKLPIGPTVRVLVLNCTALPAVNLESTVGLSKINTVQPFKA